MSDCLKATLLQSIQKPDTEKGGGSAFSYVHSKERGKQAVKARCRISTMCELIHNQSMTIWSQGEDHDKSTAPRYTTISRMKKDFQGSSNLVTFYMLTGSTLRHQH
ncbi:hypothetical protein ACRRTK_022077 [Alexandromys fortis]